MLYKSLVLLLVSTVAVSSKMLVDSALASGQLVNSKPMKLNYDINFNIEYGSKTFSGMKAGDNNWKYYEYGVYADAYLSGHAYVEVFEGYFWDINAKFYPVYVEPINLKTKTLRFEAMTNAQPWDVEFSSTYSLNFLKLKTEIKENTKTVKESIYDALKSNNLGSLIPYFNEFIFDTEMYQNKYIDPYWSVDFSKKYLKAAEWPWYGSDHLIGKKWLLGNYP